MRSSPGADDAEEALEHWQQKGPSNYVYLGNAYTTIEGQAQDTEQFDHREWRVVVEDKQVTSVSLQDNGRPLADQPLTMDGLLETVVHYHESEGPRGGRLRG